MKFELSLSGTGRRNLIIGLVVLVIVISVVVVVIRSRSKYAFPLTGADANAAEGVDLTTKIAACTTLYRQALQQGLTDSPTPKAQCVQTAVTDYFNSKCRFVVDGTAPPSTNTTAKAAYDTYTNTDAPAVTGSTQYINFGFGTLPQGLTSAIVTKARKADLTGPTRKYIETACPGFYKPAEPTNTAGDFTAKYVAWKPTASGTTGDFGFDASLVTAPNIITWANKAATPITVPEIAADTAGTTSNTKTITVTGTFPETLTNAKVKVAGITGVVLGTATAGSSSIVLTYPSQTVPLIPAGTVINKSTASGITSVKFATGSAVPIPNTSNTPTSDISTVELALDTALDSSLTTGSQVLISGSTLSGQIKIGTTISADRRTVSIDFTAQKFPILPTGSTIESVIETPLATPLVPASTLYNKIGTMSGQKMFNWQIAQVIGPGTYWNGAITWGA
jgi:hypothetical protein